MEAFVEKSLLFDFYGELLTEHQKKIYAELVFEDYSPAEIAREEGISRQSVHDMRKRCDKILQDYEDRLHLVRRFLDIRNQVREIQRLTEPEESRDDLRRIREIALNILEEL